MLTHHKGQINKFITDLFEDYTVPCIISKDPDSGSTELIADHISYYMIKQVISHLNSKYNKENYQLSVYPYSESKILLHIS